MKIRLLVLAGVLALAAGAVFAQQSSDFDAETVGAWAPPTAGEPDWTWQIWGGTPKGEVLINNTYYRSAPNSMCKLRETGEVAPGACWNMTLQGTTNLLSFWVLSTDVNQSDSFYFYTGPSKSGSLLFVVWLQSGYLRLEGVSGKNSVAAISNGIWYKVTVAVDFDADEVMMVVRDENGYIAGGPYTDGFKTSASIIGSIASYEGITTTPRFFYDDFNTQVSVPTPNMSTFDAQDTGTNWVPDGTSLSEYWVRGGSADAKSRLVISESAYHGTGGKAMGQVRYDGGAAPQPKWSCDVNQTEDYVSFWYMQVDTTQSGSDWVIRKGGTYLMYVRFQAPTLGVRVIGGDSTLFLLGAGAMLPNTWYHFETQMDFAGDRSRHRLTREGDAYGEWSGWATFNGNNTADDADNVWCYCNSTPDPTPIVYVDDFSVGPFPVPPPSGGTVVLVQ